MSLGLRRTLHVKLDPTWEDVHGRLREEYVLHAADFDSELGVSPVHSLKTQLRLVELASVTCRLMHSLSTALDTMYHHEGLEERMEAVSRSLVLSINNLHRAIGELQHWHEGAIQIFPSPVSLDDSETHESVMIYANVLFIFQSSAIFALHTNLIFIHELVPASRSLLDKDTIEEAVEALEDANGDIMQRTRELVQVRLLNLLPISVTPLMGPPLLLQAINLSAVRGTQMEAVESRKLDIFTRTLESSRERFHGSDFVYNVLRNMIAYAEDDEKFMVAMKNWRRDSEDSVTHNGGQRQFRLDWSNLVCQRPRLFLRLMMHLDRAFCTGLPPEETDFPQGLQRHAA